MVLSLLLGAPAVPRQLLPSAQFLLLRWSGGLLSNEAFIPPANAAAAHLPFRGTLALREAEMTIKPRPPASKSVLGRDVTLFPGVAISFFTLGADLVPQSQDVIRFGSSGSGRSFWDIIVQPGRIWSEPDDGEWSRAAFPFALVNSIEGETHNGVATFLYKAGTVSNLRFQIVQQTSPFLVKGYFVAAGLVPAVFVPAKNPDAGADDASARRYAASLVDAVPFADWSDLAAKVGAGRLAGFDGKMNPSAIVASGLDYRGKFYVKECVSAAGPLPWCDRARFGVWSATKALANETALLRLAQKYGPAVFDLKIVNFVPQLAGHPEWADVRFEDAIDMATGVGNGSTKISPNDINDGYLEAYEPWYEARSALDKVKALLEAARPYPWGPGKVARYRDQDMFLLGLAMNNFLKVKEGSAADLWEMLENEVFEPIGIHYAPTNRTLETDGSPGQPLMAYGFYPTLGDMVHIARLYQNGGRSGDQQILYAPRIAALLAGRESHGLPTGEQFASGETTYTQAFWVAPFRADGCQIYYPRMIGWGGNIVALLPHGMTGIRLAKSDGLVDRSDADSSGMAMVAAHIDSPCR